MPARFLNLRLASSGRPPPAAERAARECLSLPVFPELTDAQVEYVAAAIREFQGW